MLKSLSTDRIKGWENSWPHFAFEVRERFQQTRGRSFNMLPTESLVEDDYAEVKCDDPKEPDQIYLALFFLKTEDGWKNWIIRNVSPTKPLADFLIQRPPDEIP